MKKLVYGFDPQALRALGEEPAAPHMTAAALAALGIPERKIPRVQQELAHLAPRLEDVLAMEELAKQIANQLL